MPEATGRISWQLTSGSASACCHITGHTFATVVCMLADGSVAVAGASLGVAALAFVLSGVALALTLRQWRFAEFTTSRESTPLAVLVQIDGTWWWRISNHGARSIRPVQIEWIDVDPPEVAAERQSMPWGIPTGSEVFVPALGNPKPGRRIRVSFEIVDFRWWRRTAGEWKWRAYMGNATIDPTVCICISDESRSRFGNLRRMLLRSSRGRRGGAPGDGLRDLGARQ